MGYSGVVARPDTPGAAWPVGTAVLPAYRNRGIATVLKARCVAHARSRGFQVLHSASGSAALLRVNERFGFRALWTEVRLVRRLGEPVDAPLPPATS